MSKTTVDSTNVLREAYDFSHRVRKGYDDTVTPHYTIFQPLSLIIDIVEWVYQLVWDIVAFLSKPFVYTCLENSQMLYNARVILVALGYFNMLWVASYAVYALVVSVHTFDSYFFEVSFVFTLVWGVLSLLSLFGAETFPRWALHMADDQSPRSQIDRFTFKVVPTMYFFLQLMILIFGLAHIGRHLEFSGNDDADGFWVESVPGLEAPSAVLSYLDSLTSMSVVTPPVTTPTTTMSATTTSVSDYSSINSDDFVSIDTYLDVRIIQNSALLTFINCICCVITIIDSIAAYTRRSDAVLVYTTAKEESIQAHEKRRKRRKRDRR